MSGLSAPAVPKKEDTKGERFLRKAERQQCWGARDAFWQCMKANQEDESKCTQTREGFLKLCPPTWVTHFDRKFQYEKFKVKLAKEGHQALDDDFARPAKGARTTTK